MKKPNLDQIPKISREDQDDILSKALDVLANGEQAKIFISIDPCGWSDEKIVIIWKFKNEKFGDSFFTEYFGMGVLGILEYGYEGETHGCGNSIGQLEPFQSTNEFPRSNWLSKSKYASLTYKV